MIEKIYSYNYVLFCAVAVITTVLDNFTQQSLKSGSAKVQILYAVFWRFAMVRISDSGPDWKQGLKRFVGQSFRKNNSSSSSSLQIFSFADAKGIHTVWKT